jgi:hypothetical protein
LHLGIDGLHGSLKRGYFVLADTRLGMGNLPLEVGDIDMVVIDQADVPNTCAGQIKCSR